MGIRDEEREDKQWIMYFNIVNNGQPRGLSKERKEQDDEDEYQEMVEKGYMQPPEGVDKVLIPNSGVKSAFSKNQNQIFLKSTD